MQKIKTIRLKKIQQSTLESGVYKSPAGSGHRIIGDEVIETPTTSVTFAPQPIVDVPKGVLPAECDYQTAVEKIKEMVLASELSADETEAILSLYDDYEVGKAYAKDDLFVYDSTLYKVNQAHTSQADYVPGVGTDALYSPAAPEGVIPVWVQPTGAHDAYALDALVQWPEGGTVWRSTIPANTTEPGTLLPWGYWVEHTVN